MQHGFGDPSRDLAAVLLKALEAEPGEGVVGLTDAPGDGPRLQDLVTDEPLEVTVHDGFDYWIADVEDPTAGGRLAGAGQRRRHPQPPARLRRGGVLDRRRHQEHLRWVMPYDEEPLLDALARLHVAGQDMVAEGSRLVGMFRAHGLLVPVWDLPSGTGAEVLEEPAPRFGAGPRGRTCGHLAAVSGDERAARNGLTNRQLTIR